MPFSRELIGDAAAIDMIANKGRSIVCGERLANECSFE